jgi:hypothetical protein
LSSSVSRSYNSVPQRSAAETWAAITHLLAPSAGAARLELESIGGIACSLITDQAMTAPIVVTGSGPRVRVYCIYDDDAIEGGKESESPLAFCPTSGDWAMSLPCPTADLAWVQRTLTERSSRITARDRSLGIALDDETKDYTQAVVLFDEEAFLKR